METFKRAVVTLVLSLAFLAGLVLIQRPIAHGAPSMTPQAAPVPRVAPTAEQVVRPATTPLPRPGF